MLFLLVIGVGAADSRDLRDVPFYGVAGHFLHTRQIYPDKDDSWLISNTEPTRAELGAPWVAEQIYALTGKNRALVNDGTANNADKFRIEQRRALVDKWLDTYDAQDVQVLLTIIGAGPKARNAKGINEDFANWIAELVGRHRSIKVVQLHNEPNLRSFWAGTPADYVDTYRSIAHKIKHRNPNVIIAVGAISSLSWGPGRLWLKEAIKDGLLDYADAISVHPYNLTAEPEVDPHTKYSLRDSFREFWAEIQAASPAGKQLRLYLTEFGYSSAIGGQASIGSEELQANYLARLMLLYADFRVKENVPIDAVFWYDLKNDGRNKSEQEHNFGLVSADLKRKKPAFYTYQRIIQALPDIGVLKSEDTDFSTNADNIVVLSWVRPTGEKIIAAWQTGIQREGVHVEIKLPADESSKTANFLNLVTGEQTQRPLGQLAGQGTIIIKDLRDVTLLTLR
ncbi:cellulase family glycosylhydrolase [Rhizobium sp. Rhizsp82]|uniref:cellulase family glycosylhydrolase n=1 Tax=Rhizobium sp. Rhizsp82 TaxID=3243057 RepID=UPI0039B63907